VSRFTDEENDTVPELQIVMDGPSRETTMNFQNQKQRSTSKSSSNGTRSEDFLDFETIMVVDTQNQFSLFDLDAENSPQTVCDLTEYRQQLPVLGASQFKASLIWPFVKDAIGKDLTTISLPVFINEPLTTLQKSAELMCFSDDFFTKAVTEADSLKRMVYIATYNAATYFLVKART
jgi:hypothetical protein